MPVERDFIQATRERVVVFDGGMGATLEQFDLTPDYTAICEGTADRNGFYGEGIVDAFAASKRP